METHRSRNVQLSYENRFGNKVEGLFFKGSYCFFAVVSRDGNLRYFFPGFAFFVQYLPVWTCVLCCALTFT